MADSNAAGDHPRQALTVDELVEAEIARASSALNRNWRQKRASETEEQPTAEEDKSYRDPLTNDERRSILQKLAAERAERRGFASSREQHLQAGGATFAERNPVSSETPSSPTLPAQHQSASAASSSSSAPPPLASPPPPTLGVSHRAYAAAHSTISDAASRAISDALASVLRGRADPTTASTTASMTASTTASTSASMTASASSSLLSPSAPSTRPATSTTAADQPVSLEALAGHVFSPEGDSLRGRQSSSNAQSSSQPAASSRVATSPVQRGAASSSVAPATLAPPNSDHSAASPPLQSSSPTSTARRQATTPQSSSSSPRRRRSRGSASHSAKKRSERDQLVARLLAERQAKLHQSRKSSSASPPAATSASPPLPAASSPHRTSSSSFTPGTASRDAARSAVLRHVLDKRRRDGSRFAGQDEEEGDGVLVSPSSPSRRHQGSHSPDISPLQRDEEGTAERRRRRDRRWSSSPKSEGDVAATPSRGASLGGSRLAHSSRSATRSQSAAPSRPPPAATASPEDVPQPAGQRRYYRRTKEALRREREEQLRRECTFQPQLQAAKKARVDAKTRRQRLYEDKSRAWKEREAKKRREEERKLQEYQFRPRTTVAGGSKSGTAPASTGNGEESAADRLYREAERRRQRQQEAARARRQEQEGEFAFQPEINPTSSQKVDPAQYRPLHERVEDMQRVKEENVHRRRMERLLEDDDLTFQPQINQRSERLARSEGGGGLDGGVQRLMDEAQRAQQRKLARTLEHAREEADQASFNPRINPRSDRLVAKRGDFEMRQAESERERREKELQRMLNDPRARDCTFRPNIGNADQVLAQTRPTRLAESAEERAERLSRVDYEKAMRMRDAMQEEYYSKFSFRPEINPISRQLGRTRTAEEHMNDERRKMARLTAAAEAEAKIQKECTFQPEIGDASRVLAEGSGQAFRLNVRDDPEGLSKRLKEYHESRERRQEALRLEREYRELKDCPFVPIVESHKAPREPEGPIVVRGLGRHLELQEMAQHKAEDQRRREEEAFQVRSQGGGGWEGPTVPEPFHFTYRPRCAAGEASHHEETTFHPKTSTRKHRAVIDAMLEPDDGEGDGNGRGRAGHSTTSLRHRRSGHGRSAADTAHHRDRRAPLSEVPNQSRQ